jgi:nucleoid-associated protein YgaU
MIFRGSRYEGVAFTGIKTLDGKTRKMLHDRKIYSVDDVPDTSIEHVVVGEETLDSLADRFYKDDRLWWIIADVNDILFAFDITPGDILLIPDPNIVRGLITS